MSEDYPARLYAAVHDGNPGDVEFYRRSCGAAASVLELGCGDGRVLAGITPTLAGGAPRQRVGVDLDAEQLELAQARDAGLELICADMRAFADALDGRRFERVIIPHGGLYCLLEPGDLERTLAEVARVLAPGGLLVFDAWAADAFHAEADPEDQDPAWLERVKTIELDDGVWEVLERSTWDKARQRLDVTYLHVRVGDEQGVEGLLRQRYTLAPELRAAVAAAGFELVSLAGDFEGADYGPEATLMVGTARRVPQA